MIARLARTAAPADCQLPAYITVGALLVVLRRANGGNPPATINNIKPRRVA